MPNAAATDLQGNCADADILALCVPGREKRIAQLNDVHG
jgi:hypothetical protein